MNEQASNRADVGRVPPRGVPMLQQDAGSAHNEPPPRRLRRLHRGWPDREGNISYLLTTCVEGRARVLDNESTFERLVAFLLDSPTRYRWFGRRFVIMPDHIHLIAHMGHDAVRLGQWIKALKAVVGGLKPRDERPVGTPGLQDPASSDDAGRVPTHGVPVPSTGGDHEFTRIKRAWRWQDGYHDHKFRTPESESRKWEYVCLNPVRAGFVKRPEEWPFGGEIFYDEASGPRLVCGTPPLLETGMLIEEDGKMPREGTRPTT
jgi:REP element-mobilizing transposase RayT